MNIFTKTAVLAAIAASLTVPLLMANPATAGGLVSPEELVIRGVTNGLTSIARDAERQWKSHYALKKCYARYGKRAATRICDRYR
ncbi:MAG: hypothetical protein WBV18_03770 [Methyloceanibacter sp.]|jgi:hypothetical protein|uniref:hypothetical protein n=1 Tax=Methyloceanibacter sp. TaxID=1965321 RepID=UPI003C3F4907